MALRTRLVDRFNVGARLAVTDGISFRFYSTHHYSLNVEPDYRTDLRSRITGCFTSHPQVFSDW